jgi:hypothetical protein
MAVTSASQAGLVQMYDTNLSGTDLDSVAEAEAVIAASGGADFTTNVDYIAFDGDSFPGPAFGAPPNDGFVMRVTGTLDTSPFSRLRMDHDDGFVVRLNGIDFFSYNGNTPPITTYSGALPDMGIVSFEMIFWDQGGVQWAHFGGTVHAGGDFHAFIGDPVPEPGTVSLVGAALVGLMLMRRRRSA